ncbi:MAG: Rrf2 family transcriptional regulator [Gallionella sp.]|jgi:Rrf2 family nitric oxide-sensitive transcriptional repressor|nr:Rrf2 family transcriptional regulator [Gallionella sp.]
MQLNLSTDIALRTLIYLGGKGGSATIAEVSEAFSIVRTHLMKVVMALVAANLVLSERGRNGGIRLARNPAEITVGEVVRVMESNLALLYCLRQEATNDCCPLMPACKLRKVFFNAQKQFLQSLEGSTLADIL